MVNVSSLERLVPSRIIDGDATGRATLDLHVERYAYAASFIKGGHVLDCACGVGYGSATLANAADRVTGVDIDASAVEYAREHYANERTTFVQCDGANYHSSEQFDAIVSFETIEHVPDPDALVANLAGLLQPCGSFIASVPITPSVDVNPYHLHDFTKRSFLRLFERHGLRPVHSIVQVQKWSPLSMLKGEEQRLSDMRANLAHYWLTHPGAVLKRGFSTVVDGFCNKYLVCAFERPARVRA